MDKELENYSYTELSNAIIIQAVNDYRDALSRCASYNKLTPEAIKLEKFFRSQWYYELTDLDGETIIKRIRKEVFGK